MAKERGEQNNNKNINTLDNRKLVKMTIANLIVPVKFNKIASYVVPDKLVKNISTGSWVTVDFASKTDVTCIVESLCNKELYITLSNDTLGYGSQEKFDDTGNTVKHADTGTDSDTGRDNNTVKYEDPCTGIAIKEIKSVYETEKTDIKEITFWHQLSDYYMCTMGEIMKAAYPDSFFKKHNTKSKKTVESYLTEIQKNQEPIPNTLSEQQEKAYHNIKKVISSKPVLLQGVTGSGKTEIYINLAIEAIKRGEQVLFMVPEISLSQQLQTRLKRIFGKMVVTYHSQETSANKRFIHKLLTYNQLSDNCSTTGTTNTTDITDTTSTTGATDNKSSNIPLIVLGTRSSLFLPFSNLGLIIVDEEHDTSYKQTEPNPRYNGRDAAILLARIHNSKILLGSATPSLETIYNVYTKKFEIVELNSTYFGAKPPKITIIDTLKARKTRQMNGNFSQQLINCMKKELENGGQIMIFRNRRSYSPQIECFDCGYSPTCPHCNVHLSYHKSNNRLYCHHCEYSTPYRPICPSCGGTKIIFRGVGTEKLEEELANLFPDKIIARYDADTTKSIRYKQETLKSFSSGEIDILVGTQMISKGFDFPHLSLVVVMQAETMVGIDDFRADERAIQLLKQVMGRTGRRDKQGKFIIQTSSINHPVFKILTDDITSANSYIKINETDTKGSRNSNGLSNTGGNNETDTRGSRNSNGLNNTGGYNETDTRGCSKVETKSSWLNNTGSNNETDAKSSKNSNGLSNTGGNSETDANGSRNSNGLNNTGGNNETDTRGCSKVETKSSWLNNTGSNSETDANGKNPYREYMQQLLKERKEYNFAPFVKMIKIIVRHKNIEKLHEICDNIKNQIVENQQNIGYIEITGPFSPVIDRVRGEYIRCFYIKFARNNAIIAGKQELASTLSKIKGNGLIILDVDPL